ncbi:uncharacterized protein LOC144429521 [Styela clava]
MDDSTLPKPSYKLTLKSSYQPATEIIPTPLPQGQEKILLNSQHCSDGKQKYVVYLNPSIQPSSSHEDARGNSQIKVKLPEKSSPSTFSRNTRNSTRKILPRKSIKQNAQYIVVPASTNIQKLQARLLLPSNSVSIPKQKSAPDLRTLCQSVSLHPSQFQQSIPETSSTGFQVSSFNTASMSNDNVVLQDDIGQFSSRNQFDTEQLMSNFSKADSLVPHTEEIFSGPYFQSLIEGDSSMYHPTSTNENVEIGHVLSEDANTHPYLIQIPMPSSQNVAGTTVFTSLANTTWRAELGNKIINSEEPSNIESIAGVSSTGQVDVEMPVQSINLDGHSTGLLQKLDEFRKKEEFCDLTIVIGRTEMHCHSAVVAAMSPVLYCLLQPQSQYGTSLKRKIFIKLDDKLDAVSLSDLLDSMYTGCIKISKNTAKQMLIISSYLKMTSVQNICGNYYKSLFVNNMFDFAGIYSYVAGLSDPSLCSTSTDITLHDLTPANEKAAYQTQSTDEIESRTIVSDNEDDQLVVDENPTSSNCLETADVTKPRSSLTNLVRVASEAFEDLDQEESIDDSLEVSTDDNTALSSEECQDAIQPDSNNETLDITPPVTNEKWCKICEKQFSSTKRYKNHQKIVHSQSQKKSQKCSYCEKRFGKLSDRLLHEKRIHTNEKPYHCEVCKKKFCLQRELKRHLKSHKENNLVCMICGKKLGSDAGMKLHIKAHGEKKFKCRHSSCNTVFATIQLRKRHEKSHSLRRPFQCDKCEAAFKSNHELIRHKLTHSGEKLFKCDKCSKSFGRAEHLKNHMLTHDDSRRFKCSKCGKTFKQKAGLNVHERKHSAPFNYVCDICGYKCHSKGYLQLHSVTHSNERPFRCDICLTRFKAKKHLNRHLKIHERKGETDAEKYKELNNAKSKNSMNKKKLKKNDQVIFPKNIPLIHGKTVHNKASTNNATHIIPKDHSIQTNFYDGESMKLYALSNQHTVTVLPSLREAFCSGSTSNPSQASLQIQESSVQVNEDLLQFSNAVLLDTRHIVDKNMNENGTNTSPWQCSAQEIRNDEIPDTETSMNLTDEDYVPVLTAEDFL